MLWQICRILFHFIVALHQDFTNIRKRVAGMKDDKFYQKVEKELERKQSIVSALKKILQSFEAEPKEQKKAGFLKKNIKK